MIDTTNILFVLSGAFVGLESMVNRRLGKGVSPGSTDEWLSRLTRLSQSGLVLHFLDPVRAQNPVEQSIPRLSHYR